MRYELTIHGAQEENGTIDLVRLSHIAHGITKVAQGALLLRLLGISNPSGRPSKVKKELEKSIRMSLTGLKTGSTRLEIESPTFEQTLPPKQLDAFKDVDQSGLAEMTPMGLFIEAYHAALDGDAAQNQLDRGLVKELRKFKQAFRSDKERMVLENAGSVRKLELDKRAFERIHDLEETMPPPRLVVVNGRMDMFRHSKALIEIILADDKKVEGFLSEQVGKDTVKPFLGEPVTVKGLLHRRAGGKEVLEVQGVFTPTEGDAYFSKMPRSLTVKDQMAEYVRKPGRRNPITAVKGKWPGDEDLETILRTLKE